MSERILTYRQAVAEAMAEEMARDERVFLMGEDVGKHGGAFAASKGLFDEFGPGRVKDAHHQRIDYCWRGCGAADGHATDREIM
jgi:pyruvate/2-oxoglutarate/acetoin dehydrogenase E1 component